MVTAAVLGAAVGVGAALVLTLTLLIYRYHAAQKKEAADGYHRHSAGSYSSTSWSRLDSWAPPPTPSPLPIYKSTSSLLDGASGRTRPRPPQQLYLPVTHHNQSLTSDHPVQPPVPSLPGPQRHQRSHHQHGHHGQQQHYVPSSSAMSAASSSSSSSVSANNNNNKRSSPLNYFSLDIPASLGGGGGGSGSSSPSLPHQSCSLPFVARLVRTPSTSSAGHGSVDTYEHGPLHPPQQAKIENSHGFARSPSPSCRGRLAASPTPSYGTASSNSSVVGHAAMNATPGSASSTGSNLNLTPYPSPMVSPSPAVSPTPSFSSIFNSLASSGCTSPSNQSSAASPLVRRSRSPMLATLSKMNSIQSSTSTASNQSQGSMSSLCCPPTPALTGATPTPLGALQPELYKRETTIHVGLPPDADSDDAQVSTSDDGFASCSSGQLPTSASSMGVGSLLPRNSRTSSAIPLGRLHFRLSYDFDKSDLLVHLVEVRDLSVATDYCGPSGSTSSTGSSSGNREAHVRLSISPEVDQRRRQSARTIRLGVDSSAAFDERFKFPVSHDQLSEKTLRFQIFEYDRFSRPCVMGDLQFSLAERENLFGSCSTGPGVDVWADMMRNTAPDESRPQVLLSLSYLPSAERLTVVVLKAKNLVAPANKEHVDPLVKLYLMVNGKRLKKKKTEVRKATCNPVWNQALTFTIPSPKLHSCTLEIVLVDHGSERGGKSAQLGCITLGPDRNPSSPERQHWQDMAHNVRKSIAMWHYLQ